MEVHNLDLKKKYDAMEQHEVMYEARHLDDADIMIIAFGIPSRIAKTAIQFLRQQGIKAGLLKPITLFPFPSKAIHEYSQRIHKVLVVEMNTGQMLRDVQLACHNGTNVYFYGRPGDGIPYPDDIIAQVEKIM